MASEVFRRHGRPPVPAGTPPEIADGIGWGPRRPVDPADSDCGIPVDLPPLHVTPPHRLVVLGDSISHGFKSFAISHTDLSWPAMVARAAGFQPFRHPVYAGPAGAPGLPLNLEAVMRHLRDVIPSSLVDVPDDVRAALRLRALMDDVEDYWERGDGAEAVRSSRAGAVNHNLAIWGWDVRDTIDKSVGYLERRVAAAPGRRDQLLEQIPSAAGERSALITLAGGDDGDTPLTLAKKLGTDGVDGEPGIETLVVALGANNVLGTVLDFDVRWTPEDPDRYRDLDAKSAFNAWAPSHFTAEFDALVARLETIAARHVLVFTVPHVTIAPMVRGVANKMPGDRYFARYSRPWIDDQSFRPNRDACMTGDELRVLDYAVDCYNDHIVRRVQQARRDERDWRVFDIAGILDRLAYRRYLVDDQARPEWWTPYDLPPAYQELSPQPDTRFYGADRFGRYRGGLFSLDGVHPSTSGYGIIAREVMGIMARSGVEMDATQPNFEAVLALDTMISNPPGGISDVLDFVEFANRIVGLYRSLSGRAPV